MYINYFGGLLLFPGSLVLCNYLSPFLPLWIAMVEVNSEMCRRPVYNHNRYCLCMRGPPPSNKYKITDLAIFAKDLLFKEIYTLYKYKNLYFVYIRSYMSYISKISSKFWFWCLITLYWRYLVIQPRNTE